MRSALATWLCLCLCICTQPHEEETVNRRWKKRKEKKKNQHEIAYHIWSVSMFLFYRSCIVWPVVCAVVLYLPIYTAVHCVYLCLCIMCAECRMCCYYSYFIHMRAYIQIERLVAHCNQSANGIWFEWTTTIWVFRICGMHSILYIYIWIDVQIYVSQHYVGIITSLALDFSGKAISMNPNSICVCMCIWNFQYMLRQTPKCSNDVVRLFCIRVYSGRKIKGAQDPLSHHSMKNRTMPFFGNINHNYLLKNRTIYFLYVSVNVWVRTRCNVHNRQPAFYIQHKYTLLLYPMLPTATM